MASTGAVAFEETKGGNLGLGTQSGAAQPKTQAPSLDITKGLSLSTDAPVKGEAGTKIRIPGLGVIGEIPKLDFGLELLYSTPQPKPFESDKNEPSGIGGRVNIPLNTR